MQSFKLSVLIILISLSANSFAQSTKLDVQEGQKFRVETSSKVNSSAEVMGQTMENNVDTKTHTVYEIVKTESDGIKLHSTITKLQVNASAMGQEMAFDSDKSNNEGPMADMLSKKLNKKSEMTIDEKGNVIKREGNEDDGSMGAMMGAPGSGQEPVTELFIPGLLGRELKTGESFTDISSVKREKYESRDSGTYTVTNIENGVASISYTGKQVTSATMEQMGMEMVSASNNIVKTELQMDIHTGMVLVKATVIESTVSIEAGGMSIPATGKSIITMKISPVQ